MPIDVVLYTRRNCTLCRTAESDLEQLAGRFPLRIEYRDVDSRADWRQAFGLSVPVVFIAGRRAFDYRIDEEAFAQYALGLDSDDNNDHT